MSHVVAGSAITRQTMPEYRGFIAQCMMPRGDAIPLLMDEMLAIRKSWTMVSKYDFQCFFFERLMDIFPVRFCCSFICLVLLSMTIHIIG